MHRFLIIQFLIFYWIFLKFCIFYKIGNEAGGEQPAGEAPRSATDDQPASPAPPHTPAHDDLASSSVQQDERQPPPPPPPSEASPEDEDSDATFFYSSSDDESGANQREVLRVVRNFSEPRNAILRSITSRNGEGDVAGGSAFARFYTRRATPQERESHRIEDRNRLVYERFDETDITDRRVNEGKNTLFLIEKKFRASKLYFFFCYNFSCT